MDIKIFSDGGSSGNPGPSAIAFIIFSNSVVLFKHSEKIGVATNNYAEYLALIKSLKKTFSLLKQQMAEKPSKIIVYSDSLLMVNQLNGLYKIKSKQIGPLVFEIKTLEKEIKIPIYYHYIPREDNSMADSLVRRELY